MNLYLHYLFILASVAIPITSSQSAISSTNNVTQKHFIYNVYKYDEIIRLVLNETTEQILDFYEPNDTLRGYPTRVHVSSNDSVTEDHPLFITAVQQKGVISWQLPLVIQTKKSIMRFKDMARTLCAHDEGPNVTTVNRPLLHVSTSHPRNVTVGIKLRRVQDFYVQLNKSVEFTVTPSQPKYYYFSFDNDPQKSPYLHAFHKLLPQFNYTIPKSVMLIIESDNEVCATVSIQPKSCPVFVNEQDMLYQGYHLTMASKGGIAITQSMFPNGFYIVFIVNQSDDECTGASDESNEPSAWNNLTVASAVVYERRNKTFKFHIVATITYTEYIVGATVLVAITVVVALLVVLITIPFAITCKQTEVLVESRLIEEEPGTSGAVPEQVEGCEEEDTSVLHRNRSRESAEEMRQSISSGESLVEASATTMTVAGLSRTLPRAQVRRSDRYFYTSLTVAVVYSLPVIQLLFTYQQMVFQTGNQDLCYYNFLCAHPLGLMSDFNHVYSNVAYMILGVVFMMQIRYRQHVAKNTAENMGIPLHHGLFYSMGLALIMEGLLSGCYHLCPNKMNFQFDSSFMYVIAVLCMVKLYQNRHPDVNASAHSTFLLLAAVMTLGVIGILYPSVYFWALFTILHLGTCLVLTLKIYYFGRFKLHRNVARRAWTAMRINGRNAFVPHRRARALLLALANLANWALAIYGLSKHNKDFARHLLAILMGNTILYTMFYFVMKLINRERIFVYTWLYFIFAHIAWFTALKFFLDSKTKWSQTPAASRAHNNQCSVLQFYDSHDVWHLLSATAMFLSFNLLLTMDDALKTVPTDLIPVF